MRLIVILISLFCCSLALANPVDDLNKRLQQIKTLSANFQQTVTGEYGDVLQHSSGTVQLSRPGKFRWSTNKPMQQIIITNGDKVWVYEPDLEQVTIKKLQTSLSETPLLLLTDKDILVQQQFYVTTHQDKGLTWFSLTPKDQSQMFKHLSLGFKSDQLQQMQLLNNLSQKTVLKFSNVKLNQPINVATFSFKVPRGVDVMDMTKQ